MIYIYIHLRTSTPLFAASSSFCKRTVGHCQRPNNSQQRPSAKEDKGHPTKVLSLSPGRWVGTQKLRCQLNARVYLWLCQQDIHLRTSTPLFAASSSFCKRTVGHCQRPNNSQQRPSAKEDKGHPTKVLSLSPSTRPFHGKAVGELRGGPGKPSFRFG